MKIVVIGAGNLATNLAKALKGARHEIVQVFSRTEESASMLAEILNCPFTTSLDDVSEDSDIYIVAIKDMAVQRTIERLVSNHPNRFCVHTAGSMPMGIAGNARPGVLYPMQTFSKQKDVDFRVIPCFVEAGRDEDLQMLKTLASSVSDNVYVLDSESRKYLHVAAVFCCNFVNRCFAISAELLKAYGDIPFSVMLPLIDETTRKIHVLSPQEAQTGPAIRWDTNVIDKHLELLADKPDTQKIYELISKSIHDDKL